MNFEIDLQKCLTVLKNGGKILYPTDTVWGIGCDATNEAAVESIYKLKQRSEQKSMIIFLEDETRIIDFARTPNNKINIIITELKKPITVIYSNAKNLASNLINEDGTIAIRIPSDEFCNQLLKAFGKPIVSTSANISGEKTAANFKEISKLIKENVNYVCAYRQDDKSIAKPSKIVKWNYYDSIEVIR